MSLHFRLILVCVLGVVWDPLSAAVVRADEAPHARAYLNRLLERVDRIGSHMEALTSAAEVSAEALDHGAGFGVRGDGGMARELSQRAGAMMGYDGRRGESGDVVLYVLGLPGRVTDDRANLATQIRDASELKARGSVVIGLASRARLRSYGLLDEAQDACTVLIDNHAPAADGRLKDAAGRTVAPMETVLNAVSAWAYECELFAALTRRGRVPVVRQSFEIDTRQSRWNRYGFQRFHHDRWLDPIESGVLGRAYLDGLTEVLRNIGTASWRSLSGTAVKIEQVLRDDGIVWLRVGGRYLPYHVGTDYAGDPGLFRVLTHDGSNPSLASPGEADYLLAVGRYETAGSWEWGEPELLRQAGRGVTWIVNGYNTQRADLKRNERLIDLWGPVGDCVVKVADYDARLGPVGSVTAEAVLWMIAVEVQGRLSSGDDEAALVR